MQANEMKADVEMQLYLGSIALLLGDPQSAAVTFEQVVEATSNSGIREEGFWQLANAQLAAGREGEAREALQKVIAESGRHENHARTLLQELGE